jgi:hypothetical protein
MFPEIYPEIMEFAMPLYPFEIERRAWSRPTDECRMSVLRLETVGSQFLSLRHCSGHF